VERFRRGQSVWPSTVTCVGVEEEIDQRIRDNQEISVNEIVPEMRISRGKKQCKIGLRPNGIFYYDWMRKCVDCWTNCIENQGDDFVLTFILLILTQL
jgi:hypothetical protein